MNNFKTFCEATNQKLIVVDVQPTYRGYISFDIWKFLEYVQSFKQVLYIHNGRDTSNDDRQDVKNWLIEEADYDDDFINHMDSWDWQEKEFGFLRPWMDNGASDDFIVKALRFMEKNRKEDSRDIEPEVWAKKFPKDWNDAFEDDPLYIPDVDLRLLKKYNNATIIGGGKNECLKEMELYMQANKIKTKRNNKFTY